MKVAGINLYWNICKEKDRKRSFSNLVTLWYAVHVFRCRIEHKCAENSGWVWEKKLYAMKRNLKLHFEEIVTFTFC